MGEMKHARSDLLCFVKRSDEDPKESCFQGGFDRVTASNEDGISYAPGGGTLTASLRRLRLEPEGSRSVVEANTALRGSPRRLERGSIFTGGS